MLGVGVGNVVVALDAQIQRFNHLLLRVHLGQPWDGDDNAQRQQRRT